MGVENENVAGLTKPGAPMGDVQVLLFRKNPPL